MLLLQLLLVHKNGKERGTPAHDSQKHRGRMQLCENHALALHQGPAAHQDEAPREGGEEQPGGYHEDGVVGEKREGLEAIHVGVFGSECE